MLRLRPQLRRLLVGFAAGLVLASASAASAAPLADGRGGGRAATASVGAPGRLSAFGVAAGGNIQNLGAADLARELDLYATGGAEAGEETTELRAKSEHAGRAKGAAPT